MDRIIDGVPPISISSGTLACSYPRTRPSAIQRQMLAQTLGARQRSREISQSCSSPETSANSPWPMYSAVVLLTIVMLLSLLYRQQVERWQQAMVTQVSSKLYELELVAALITLVENRAGAIDPQIKNVHASPVMASVGETARYLATVPAGQLSEQFIAVIKSVPEAERLRFAGALFNELHKIAPDIATEQEYQLLSKQLHRVLLAHEEVVMPEYGQLSDYSSASSWQEER